MLTPTFVTTPEELHQIARLSQDNLATAITPEEKIKEGYVTWPYTPEILDAWRAIAPPPTFPAEIEDDRVRKHVVTRSGPAFD